MDEVLLDLLGEVPGEVLALLPRSCRLPAPPQRRSFGQRALSSTRYPAQGLTGAQRQQGNLANGLPNYTYEVIWSFATALICI